MGALLLLSGSIIRIIFKIRRHYEKSDIFVAGCCFLLIRSNILELL